METDKQDNIQILKCSDNTSIKSFNEELDESCKVFFDIYDLDEGGYIKKLVLCVMKKVRLGNYILIIVVFIIMGCSTQTNKYSSVADEKNYGILNYNFKDEEIIDVTDLMINQSISTFIISSAFRVLTINTLKKMNSLSDKNKEKHLKAIYIAVNYLEVGKTSMWNELTKKFLVKLKFLDGLI